MTLKRLPMCADLINENYSDYSLLDMGCRTMALKPYLNDCKEYFGADLMPAEGVIECNLEDGLPNLEDNSYDVVVALDVLEHLENIHHTFKEALRVAKKAVIISLPNMFYIEFRLRFLMGNGLSGKYNFPINPILDRHRWVLSYTDAVNFVAENAKGYEVIEKKIIPERGRTKLIVEPLQNWAGDKWPDLFAYGSLFMIKKIS